MSDKLTRVQLNTLQLISTGVVSRIYRSDGNTIAGAHSATVRGLETRRLVTESRTKGGPFQTKVRLELTEAGRALLAEQPS